MLATGGSVDGTVKIWNTSTGALRSTLKGGSSNAIISLDITGNLVAGGGSDKTCRIWNHNTNRMVHHLVGHGNKITGVKFLEGERGIITASADRRMKVWDISKQTYRQTSTMHLHSTANSIDVGIDSSTVVSGHVDGSIQLWDARSGKQSSEIGKMHESAITSVRFHPMDSTKVLTNGMDSSLKIIDLRNCKPTHVFNHKDFQTSYSWSSSSFSPDGLYVASGSSSNGLVFIWDAQTGNLVQRLGGAHEVGVCGFAWGRGGESGQQVASVDKSGRLVLWV